MTIKQYEQTEMLLFSLILQLEHDALSKHLTSTPVIYGIVTKQSVGIAFINATYINWRKYIS